MKKYLFGLGAMNDSRFGGVLVFGFFILQKSGFLKS